MSEKGEKKIKKEKKSSRREPQSSGATIRGQKASIAADEEAVKLQIQSLERFKPSGTDALDAYRAYSPELYPAFERVLERARDLNTQIPVPEFVFIGPPASGKSATISAILGFDVHSGVTKRPVFFNIVYQEQAAVPRCVVRRDRRLAEFDRDVALPVEKLGDEIARRQQDSVKEEPIYVTIEQRETLNFVVVDTPSLGTAKAGTAEDKALDTLIRTLVAPSHRTIVGVEGVDRQASIDMVEWVKSIDPTVSRSHFVFTHFNSLLNQFNSTRDVNTFLVNNRVKGRMFFLTNPLQELLVRFPGGDAFKLKQWQSLQADLALLDALAYDRSFLQYMGAPAVRRTLLDQVWRHYFQAVPRVQKQLVLTRTTLQASLEEAKSFRLKLNAATLRSMAGTYATDFVAAIQSLIEGTAQGSPIVNGQTLDEERRATGAWTDAMQQEIRLKEEGLAIPFRAAKLYGGHQFERLLVEFREVANQIAIPPVTMDAVATAAGVNRLNNVPNYAWAAADLASQQTRETFAPLLDQLARRARHILNRMPEIAEKVLLSRPNVQADYFNPLSYPFLTHYIKEEYFKVADSVIEKCVQKCTDEFYETKTIYWEMKQYPDAYPKVNPAKNPADEVARLAQKLFDNIRSRLVQNLVVRFYNVVLVPLQRDLAATIHAAVASLSDSQLDDLFELSKTLQRVLKHQEEVEQQIQELEDRERTLQADSHTFSTSLVPRS